MVNQHRRRLPAIWEKKLSINQFKNDKNQRKQGADNERRKMTLNSGQM